MTQLTTLSVAITVPADRQPVQPLPHFREIVEV